MAQDKNAKPDIFERQRQAYAESNDLYYIADLKLKIDRIESKLDKIIAALDITPR